MSCAGATRADSPCSSVVPARGTPASRMTSTRRWSSPAPMRPSPSARPCPLRRAALPGGTPSTSGGWRATSPPFDSHSSPATPTSRSSVKPGELAAGLVLQHPHPALDDDARPLHARSLGQPDRAAVPVGALALPAGQAVLGPVRPVQLDDEPLDLTGQVAGLLCFPD